MSDRFPLLYNILIQSRIWIAFIVASNVAFFQWMYHGRFFSDYILLMFLGTLVVYNLHFFYRIVVPDKSDSSTKEGSRWRQSLGVLCLLTVAALVWYDFHFIFKLNQWLFYGACLVAAVYLSPNKYFWQIKRLPLSKPLILSMCWLVLIAIIPARSTELLSLHPGIILHYGLVLLSMCIIFDIKDVEADHRDGIITIAGYMGLHKTKRFVFILLGVSVFATGYIATHLGWLSLVFLAVSLAAFYVVTRITRYTSARYYFIFVDGILGLYGWLVLPAFVLWG